MEQQIAYCTTADGVRIAYATYGNDGAPPLVHIPGLPGQEAIWASPWGRTFFQALARRRRLITLDFRGRGASQREVDRSRPEYLLVDLTAVADHLQLDRFELFAGGSTTNTPVVMFTGACPARVSKLVLFSPTIATWWRHVAGAESARASYELLLLALAAGFFPSGPAAVQRWFYTSAGAFMSAESMGATLSWRYDLAPVLTQLTMPVLILHRKGSQICDPAEVRAVASLIPDARLVTLDGDAALSCWDHEQFIDVVYEFLGIEQGVDTASADSDVDSDDGAGLTPREVEVLRLIVAGKSGREIAAELVLSPRTVERHVANIYRKTETHGRAQLAGFALRHKLG
jgi:pimeloyl-ACP methyl ester carboxylesterase/DNA-binding CsgD family transcriptional regulator